jgi:hypothetical protein
VVEEMAVFVVMRENPLDVSVYRLTTAVEDVYSLG